MSIGSWLQVCGGLFEVAGLVIGGMGIANDRQRFTKNPSLLARGGARFEALIERAWRWFDKGSPRQHTVRLDATVASSGSFNARLTRSIGFAGSLAEQMAKVQKVLQEHEDALDELRQMLDEERETRRQNLEDLRRDIRRTKTDLEELVSEAAAGGVRLETIGISVFAIGVLLTIAGITVSS